MKNLKFVFAILLLLSHLYAGHVSADPHKTGVRPMTPEEEARILPKMFRITEPKKLTKGVLPSSVKNTLYLPVVTSQGELGSCAAYATCYYMKTYQEAKENGWVHPSPDVNQDRIASPAWGYNIAPRLPSYGDLAVSHYTVADYICEYGIANWAEMPYDPDPDTYAWDDWPTEEEWRRGIEWRGQQAGVIVIHTPEGLDALKEHLAGGNVAVITTPVYSNFDAYPGGEYTDSEVFYGNTDTGFRGGHALTVVGYDDNKGYFDAVEGVNKKGAFLLVNSWGTDWGVNEPTMDTDPDFKGFIWLAYDFILSKKNGDPDALVIIDRINYSPELTATIGINHTKGRNLLLKIYAGEKTHPDYPVQSPQWIKDALPTGNDYPLVDSRVVIDLTDYKDYENLAWYLEVFHLQMYAGEGDINYFSVEKGDGSPVVSLDTPKSPEINWYTFFKAGLFRDAGELFGGLRFRRGGVAWADFNKDGFPDMLASGYNFQSGTAESATLLFLNNGDGTFQTGITGSLPQVNNGFISVADYDNDGYPDVSIHGYPQSSEDTITSLYRNNGNNTFSDSGVALPQEDVNSLTWADYDNDGLPDLAVSAVGQILLYRNKGDGTFECIAPSIPSSGTVAWGDINNDGLVDFVVAGEEKTAVYLNEGDGIFTDTENEFPPLRQAAAAWGDFDSDGLLDLSLSGRLSDYSPWTGIYRNNGSGTFIEIEADFKHLLCGSLAWGDINNDGLLDLIATGRTEDEFGVRYYGDYPNHSVIYLNDGRGSFRNSFAELPGVSTADFIPVQSYNNSLALIDYDMDDDLDVFLSGIMEYIYASGVDQIYTGIQENLAAGDDAAGEINTLPEPPSVLSESVGTEAGSIVLEWNAGSDAETPADGIYYNVRVGSASGMGDIVSPVNGLVTPGSVPLQTKKLLLNGLASGTYYWAVRTVDAGRAVSEWSTERTFDVDAYTRTYNLYIDSGEPDMGTTDPAPGLYTHNTGTNVLITPIPYGGYTFSHWSGDVDNPSQNPVTVVMDRPRNITAHFKIRYDISPDWEEKTSSAPWGVRISHSTVVFDEKLWVIGGNTSLGRQNDVWYSTDGTNWTQVTGAAQWTKRLGHTSLVFNNKMWVLGGYDATGYLNDVWSSENGANWTQVVSSAPWGKRCYFAALVFGTKMWVIGGKGNGTRFNDVWSSENGADWVSVTSGAQWTAREGLSATVFNNKMWIIGGYSGPVQYASDVWYSTDGSTWTAATQSANWSPRYLHTVLSLDSRLWIMGGIVRDNEGNWYQPSNEVWYSWDGTNWSLCSDTPGWSERYGHTSEVFGGRLWVLGGSRSDVWSVLPEPRPSGSLMLTIDVNNREGGTTTPAPGYYYDSAGTVFSLTATPAYGYRFTGWSGDVANPDAESTTVTLNSDKTVTSNFEKIDTYNLTISLSPAGSGTVSPLAGTYPYPSGTTVDVTAHPAYRFAFSHWTGGVTDAGSSSTDVVMNENKAVTAYFIDDPFAPAVNIAGGEGHTVFLQDEGTVWTWGLNSSGQLGDGTTVSSATPLIYSVFESAEAVSAGMSHTAALKNNGTVWTWGSNTYGQMGIDSLEASSSLPVQVTGLSDIIAVSCGGYHTVVLKNDGTVWSWGRNDSYQTGVGFTYGEHSLIKPYQTLGPAGIDYLDSITAVSAGYAHTLALKNDGTIWSWGNNTWGQLGTGDRTVRSVPDKVIDLSDIKGIAAGGSGLLGDHSLAVKSDGSVWSWGANSKGQLGDGTTTDRPAPVQVVGPGGTGYLTNIRQISAGGRHSLALDSDGNVWAWGDNTYGQIGDGSNDDRNTPVQVTVVTNAIFIETGLRHSIAVDNEGRVWVWGCNSSGQLGEGSFVDSNEPVLLDGIETDAVSKTLTVSVVPAGSGTTSPSGARKYRDGTEATVTAAAGARYEFKEWSGDATGIDTSVSVLMDADKNITANFQLQEGIKCKLLMVSSPAGAGYLVPSEGEQEFDVGTVVNILAVPGYRYRFTGWSENVADPSSAETSVTLEGDITVTAYFEKTSFQATPAISAGGQHNLILKEDSSVWASGNNRYYGELGINSEVWDAANVQVVGTGGIGYLSGVINISAGATHSSALSYDGTVYTWGRNAEGQLGDGTVILRRAPVKVKSPDGAGELTGITLTSAGSSHTCAVMMDGTLWAWGNNNFGQLGNNLTVNSPLPVQVHGEIDRGYLTGVASVAAGPEHTLAILEDGTVWAWGRNLYGQLGNGTSGDENNSYTPVNVINLTDIIAIDASDYASGAPFSMALKGNGTVWVWGGGRNGQLGNGTGDGVTDIISSVPVQVTGLTGVRAVTAGNSHALALRNDGTVWAWGSNSMGQCGDGTTDNIRTTPVQVKNPDGDGYISDVVAISAGYSYSMALKSDGTVWYWGMCQYNLFGSNSFLRNPLPVQHPYCQVDTSVEMVYLSMAVLPEGAGTTVPIESIHAYNPGSVVNVRAQANTGFVFSQWSEGSSPYLADSTVTVDSSKTVTAFFEKTDPSLGDINKDGVIDIQDVILALRMSIGLPVTIGIETKDHPYPQERIAVADINSSGTINVADAILILRLALGLSTTIPDPYEPRVVVEPETTPESVSVDVAVGEEGSGALSDGTKVNTPAIGKEYSFTLSRATNYIDPEEDFGLDPEEGASPQTSGSLRTLTFLFDSVLTDTEKLTMAPVITIPRKEIGILNPDTVNILRVSEQLIDGEVVKTHSMLPAHFDSNGNLTTRDIYLPNELLSQEVPPGTTKGNAPVYISYIPLTFQGTINWVRPCQLVRMVPDATADAKRKPITSFTEEEQEEKEWELKKPIKNVIVLVHGHNEDEKTGLPGQFERNADFPWAVKYKMEVWKYMYEIFLKEYIEFNSCTVFYEFIYPSWRPIFGHLDDELVRLITAELEKQLSYNVEEKDSMAFNLFIVAHSMGGVVSRAGIMKFPEVLDDQFKHFASWGSPHRGAAMYSLRYQVTSPAYSAKTWTGSAVSSAISAYVSRKIIDAPGIMDLRWTNGPEFARRYLRLDDYFVINDDEEYTNNDNIYNLRTGSLIYNQRLEQLNEEDNRGDKYTFMYGVTTQGIPADQIDDAGMEEIYDTLSAGEIPIGATINRFLIENGNSPLYGHIESDSDGAVPIVSMTGLGLGGATVDLGNIDHEAYYHNPDNARFTARSTFEVFGFKTNPLYDPPEVTFTNPVEDEPLETEENGDVTIQGNLDWKGPRKLEGGVEDMKLFKYTFVDEFATGFNWEGVELDILEEDWSIDSEGNFSITANTATPEQVYALRVVFVMKDDTEMQAVAMLGSPDEFQTTRQGETLHWSITGLGKVFDAGDGTYVYEKPKEGEMPGVYIDVYVNPVFKEDDHTYTLFAGKYAKSGGEPIEDVQTEVRWEDGEEEPDLTLIEASLSTNYEDSNLYVIDYDVICLSSPAIVRRVDAFLMPWVMREKEELLPPYCRPQEMSEEE